MTLNQIRDTLISLGFETIDGDIKHLSIGKGKIHVYLWNESGKDVVVIKRFLSPYLFARNLPETKEKYFADDVEKIRKENNHIIFSVRGKSDISVKENKNNSNMIELREYEDGVKTNYILEINSRDNVRFVTLTDFTRSKEVSYAEYYTDKRDWDGDKKAIINILGVIMNNKLNFDKLKDGFVVIYSNGKWEEME